MSLRDEIKTKLRQGDAGWKELVQGQPEALGLVIEIVGESIRQGKDPKGLVKFLDQVLLKRQHLNDYDLFHHLGVL